MIIDPELRHFTELPEWLEQHGADLAGKTVLTYCTGGVRAPAPSRIAGRLCIVFMRRF